LTAIPHVPALNSDTDSLSDLDAFIKQLHYSSTTSVNKQNCKEKTKSADTHLLLVKAKLNPTVIFVILNLCYKEGFFCSCGLPPIRKHKTEHSSAIDNSNNVAPIHD
jgi:hypothetical protein